MWESNKEEIQSRRQREQDFVRNCKKNILDYSRVTPGGDDTQTNSSF